MKETDTTKINSGRQIISITLSALLLIAIASFWTYAQEKLQNSQPEPESYTVTTPYIPEYLQFAGDDVPVSYYDVRESLDKELIINKFWHSSTIKAMKRANRYFPVIEPILRKNGIPEDFKYLAIAESGLDNVVSPAGASGFWQFMRGTGRSYDLEINRYVDERYHLEKATEAACKYLKKWYRVFNDWALTAAAYNAGPGRIFNQRKSQQVDSYYDLRLNPETGRYVYRIIAIKLIMEHPENYNFRFKKWDLYTPIPVKTVEVDTTINDLQKFAKSMGTSYLMLKTANPWLRSTQLPNASRKKYKIQIPNRRDIYKVHTKQH